MSTPPAPTDALLPCPFCGGSATLVETSLPQGGGWDYRFVCESNECAIGPMPHHDTRTEAIAAWNRRAPSAGKSEPPPTWQGEDA